MRNSPWLGRHTLSYAQQLDYKRDHEVRHWEWGDGALGWKFGAVRGAGGPHDDRLGNFLQSGSQGPSGFLRPCFPRLSYPPSCLACQAPPLPTVTPYCRRFALQLTRAVVTTHAPQVSLPRDDLPKNVGQDCWRKLLVYFLLRGKDLL